MNFVLQEIYITKGRKKPHEQVTDTLKKIYGGYLNGSNNKRKPKKLLT